MRQQAAESFAELPDAAKKKAAKPIELLQQHPSIYPVRRRGLMRGYRYFIADGYLFYYSPSALEVRITAMGVRHGNAKVHESQ